ncbi:MAG: carboxypeptidase regulatory-like domain-containing protein [Caldilineaceae bacterium]|nr:carboxypeptidase regulatory-like domain-containing protein [Caldilineaceae bacterium]
MKFPRVLVPTLLLCLLVLWGSKAWSPASTDQPTNRRQAPPTVRRAPQAVTGFVVDATGPVAGATVRRHLAPTATTTDQSGAFTLPDLALGEVVTLTAWAAGYYIGWQRITVADEPVQLVLAPLYTTDNVTYAWFEEGGLVGSATCAACHTAYPEWQQDAHAQTATNYRFLTLYTGTDLAGNQSPPTRYTANGKPIPPEPSQPYYGPGFQVDYPDRPGNCAACHTPMAAQLETTDGCSWAGCHRLTTTASTDLLAGSAFPINLTGAAQEGISCEFCHKIGEVRLNPTTGAPYDDAPGLLSLALRRPTPGQDLFFGPLDDVVRTDLAAPRDSYLPLLEESAFCAACHYGVMGNAPTDRDIGNVLIYSSFAEWLASPYSDPQTGQSCQDCHMPPQARSTFVFPSQGGQERSGYQVSNHQMTGAVREALLQNAVALTSTATRQDDQIQVEVAITNDQTGHAVPTDSPLRHLLLVVTAQDANGKPLALQAGPTLPAWAGNQAGAPGSYYAKILRDKETRESPTAAYWRAVELVEDTRIQPLARAESRYRFQAPAGAATITVQLRYRRAYQEIIEWKKWPDQDIIMAQMTLSVPPHPSIR